MELDRDKGGTISMLEMLSQDKEVTETSREQPQVFKVLDLGHVMVH